MTVNRVVSIVAGFMIMLSLGIGHWQGQINMSQPGWLWLTAFVGFNLFQMGFTGFCPMASMLRAAGVKDKASSSCCS